MVAVDGAEGSSVEGGEGREGALAKQGVRGSGRGPLALESGGESRTTHLWMVTVEDGEGGAPRGGPSGLLGALLESGGEAGG